MDRDGSGRVRAAQHYLIGIKPTVPAKRTILGIIEGRDEFSEKALEIVGLDHIWPSAR